MFRNALTLLTALLLTGCSLLSSSGIPAGEAAPPVNYYLLDGTVESTAALRGKAVVLAFWDAGCRHCRAEIPKLNHIAESLADRPDLQFVAISVNENYEQNLVRQTIEEFNLCALKHGFSGNGVQDEAFITYKGYLVPYLVLISKEGTVLWSGHSAEDLREPLLAELQRGSARQVDR